MRLTFRLNRRPSPVTAVAVVTAVCLLGDSMLYIVLPVFWREAGLNALWEVGILLSVNRFVRLPLNPLIGWLYHRMSLRTGLIVAMILCAVTTFGYGLFQGFAIWLVLRALWGVSWSLLRMGGYFTVISYSDDTNRGRAMGSYNGIYRLGSLFGMLAGGILAPAVGLQAVALLFGGLGLFAFPLILFYVSNEKPVGGVVQPSWKDIAGYLRSGPVLKIIVGGLLASLLYAVMSATLSLVIEAQYAETLYLFGFLAGSTALAGAIQAARWVWEPFLAVKFGRMSDGPKGRLPLLFVSLLSAGIGFALIPCNLPLYVWIVIVLSVQVTGTAVTTLMDALASDVGRSTLVVAVISAYSVAFDLGAALGPTLSFWLVEITDSIASVYLSAAAVSVLFALWFSPYAKRNARAAKPFSGEGA